jgi:integrase
MKSKSLGRRGPKPGIPRYRNKNGHAVVTLTDADGTRTDHRLGEYGSEESKAEYNRVVKEWQANRGKTKARTSDITVNELLADFLDHAEKHYRRPDGTITREVGCFKLAWRPLKALYGHTVAADFGPLALRCVREKMIEDGVSRRVVNKFINRIRHTFKWGASLELVPASVHESLRTVPSLAAGRTAAKERDPVKPVASEDVEAVLPFLRPQTRAIVELLRVTGMRPGEACSMRPCDIDRTGTVWLYYPEQHKTKWRGHERVVPIGPNGQRILEPFLVDRAPEAHVFSPREATRQLWVEQRALRKSKVFACQVRDWNKRLAKLADRYIVEQLDTAIARACEKAGIKRWGPNRLRHLHATNIRKQFGLEAASTVLGHQHMSITEVYAEKNLELAKSIAEKMG